MKDGFEGFETFTHRWDSAIHDDLYRAEFFASTLQTVLLGLHQARSAAIALARRSLTFRLA